ncbi:hypothetical protein BBD39_08280 [Arsenophonus endosymbiont of Bemisia tabaci Asia II 3]|nr:hypothetical protein BBD39_08280 [Arsenophonus endosymbiont of Bemisia tabaci Asia II 3]
MGSRSVSAVFFIVAYVPLELDALLSLAEIIMKLVLAPQVTTRLAEVDWTVLVMTKELCVPNEASCMVAVQAAQTGLLIRPVNNHRMAENRRLFMVTPGVAI